MSHAVLLAINARYAHSSLAVRLLDAGAAKYSRRRHDIDIVEADIKRDNDEIAGRVISRAPDVVGISTYIWNAGLLPALLEILRGHLPRAVFVLGGPEASHNADYWLERGADYVLRGEGERSFPLLLDALEEADDAALKNIAGLCGRQNGEIYKNPDAKPADDFPDPYSGTYLETLGGRLAYIETSRGCPFQCAYCLSGGSGVKFFPLDMLKERIQKLSGSGAKTVKFVDRTFNCDAERAYGFFEYVVSLKTACRFHFELAADLLDARSLALLSAAPPGRIQIEAGLQSFHEPTLKAVSRRTDLEKAEKNIQALLRGRNIHVHMDLIAGLPFETLTDFQNSFDRAYALGAHTLQLGFLKLLHGSRLREQAESFALVYNREPPYEIISSPWLRADDLETLRQAENALGRTYNKGRFLSVLQYAISASGLRPFSFYRVLGERVPNHGLPLEMYAERLFDFCAELPGTDADELRDRMILDLLGAVRGKSMPDFLRGDGRRRKEAAETAAKFLGRVIDSNEAAALSRGRAVFADSGDRDPVTGLYKLYFLE